MILIGYTLKPSKSHGSLEIGEVFEFGSDPVGETTIFDFHEEDGGSVLSAWGVFGVL